MSTVRTMENEMLKVAVCDHGAELFSIYDKKNEREVLWQADPKYWGRHAPVLFPFVGKCLGGYYTHKGVQYKIGQHGFARDMEFEFAGQTENSMTYILKWTEETFEKYPFKFELKITAYEEAYNENLEMFEKIRLVSEEIAKSIGVEIIPVGDAIQFLRENTKEFNYSEGGISLCRDGGHMSFDYGRFAAAAVWYKVLTGGKANIKKFSELNKEFDIDLLNVIINNMKDF